MRFIVLFLFIFTVSAAFANPFTSGKPNNPFTSGKPPTEESEKSVKQSDFYTFLVEKQKQIRNRIASEFEKIKDKPFSGSYVMFLMLSFLYGVFHSMGPGHAKALVSSHILSSSEALAKSALFGLIVAFGHAFVAFALVSFIFFVIKGTVSEGFDSASGSLAAISYSMILAAGIYLLIRKIMSKGHSHSHGSPSGFLPKALLISIVPCPGAMILTMFAFSHNMPFAGFMSVLFMAMGMAVTIGGVAVITHLFKSAITLGGRFSSLYSSVEYAGILLLISFSAFMLL